MNWQTLAFKLIRKGWYKRFWSQRPNFNRLPESGRQSFTSSGVAQPVADDSEQSWQGESNVAAEPEEVLNASDLMREASSDSVEDLPAPEQQFLESDLITLLRPEEIPRPTHWTEETFANYVDAIVSTRAPSQKNLFKYQDHEEHDSIMVNSLKQLFLDQNLQKYRSAAALDTVLNVFRRLGRFDAIRDLFTGLEEGGVPITLITFNRLLQIAARDKDSQAFHYCLLLMEKRGVLPDEDSWKHFERCVSHQAWIVFRRRLEIAGLPLALARPPCDPLNDRTGDVPPADIKSIEFPEQHVQRRIQKWDDFIVPPDELVFKVRMLCWGNNEQRASETVLASCESYEHVPPIVAVNLILDSYRRKKHPDSAIRFIQSILELWPEIRFSDVSQNNLWQLAVECHLFNLARVLWAHSCTSGQTTSWIRYFVHKYLSALSLGPISRNETQKRLLANLCVDNIPGSSPRLESFEGSKRQALEEIEVARKRSPEEFDTTKKEWAIKIRAAAYAIISSDLSCFMSVRPIRSLLQDITAAYQLDRDWLQQRLNATESCEQLRSRAYQIPRLVTRTGKFSNIKKPEFVGGSPTWHLPWRGKPLSVLYEERATELGHSSQPSETTHYPGF